ncbi:hypothetical protein PX554_20860 [Sphingomonas sp. H39-1-10]|uniref:hypothetical protein n=1 Tax=Sphingomonas pollutisoli TaxID=3030829 RepID=UPI0023B96E82|nr:hypothetical protein [Sphingomonas pollutisoli]MDF0490587.1 hypothetical protein [Sphingomonas pollutisoli]
MGLTFALAKAIKDRLNGIHPAGGAHADQPIDTRADAAFGIANTLLMALSNRR